MRTPLKSGVRWLIALVLVLVPLGGDLARAQAPRPVGTVAALVGQASVIRFGASSPAPLAAGTPLFEGDQVRTAAEGRVRIRLEDESTLQLGEETSLTLSWVLHAPALESRSVVLTMWTGIIRTVVDTIFPRSTFEVQTLTAITSVRGTDFIAEAEPTTTAVVALEGSVIVRNADPAVGGPVTLDPGEGTDVAAGAPPTGPTRWGDARRNDAIARTAVPVR